MRPVRLQIEGLRSFRAPQVIDFTGRDYIAVIGDTGAGKSSILEALTFALYGRTTFSGQGHQELMNASSTALRVVLAFDVGGEHWEAARTLRRDGTGRVSPGVTSLRHLDDEGTPIESFEKARAVTAKVESILGLNDEAFLRTVVLPQGQFARLLVDDDPSFRSNVLRQIWRTDELTEAGRLASDAKAELGPLRGRVEQALGGLPDDPDAHVAALDADLARCAEVLNAARARQREATTAVHDLAEGATQAANDEELVLTLSRWDGQAAAAAIDISRADRRSIERIAGLDKQLEGASAALAAVPSDDDGYTQTEVATFVTRLDALLGLAFQRDEAVSTAARARRDLDALKKRLDDDTSTAAAAGAAVEALLAGRTALADEVDETERRHGKAQAALHESRRTESARSGAEERLRADESTVAERASLLEGARAALCETTASHDVTSAALAEAQRGAAAAEAAHDLHIGDPCPVCERKLPHGWKPQEAAKLDMARDAHGRASRRLDEAKAEVTRREELLRAAREIVDTRCKELAAAIELASTARDVLADNLGAAADLERTDGELLADLTHRIAVSADALASHDTLIIGARAALSTADKDQARADAAHQAKVTEHSGALGRRDQAATMYARQLERLPGALRPAGDDLAAEVAYASTILGERNAVLEKRETTRRELHDETERLSGLRREAEAARHRDVDEPARRLWEAVITHHPVLRRAAETLVTAVVLPPVETRPAIGDLPAFIEVVTNATDQVTADARASAQEAHASAKEAGLVLGRLAVDLELASDDPDHIVAATGALTEDAALDRRTAHVAADSFRRRMAAIVALRMAATALEEKNLALADLSAALSDGAFPKWLTLRRSRSLLVHASRLLSEITDGRYAFADLDDEDSKWFVFDSDNGRPRSPSSLSGGEKFVASLALALGMVEMMGHQGGRIESLFIDEGFGALDRTNLDAAVEALESVAKRGRLVAVITHLRAVAEQIDHVLSVTREPTGTQTVWLSAAARSGFVENDLSTSSGLLE